MPGRRPRSTDCREQKDVQLTGTSVPFRPFLQIGFDEPDHIDSSNPNVEVAELRFQTITMLPEYRDKSLEELRFEDYTSFKHRKPLPVPFTMPAAVPNFIKVGLVVNPFINNVFAARRSQNTGSNSDKLGTYIEFQPLIGMDQLPRKNGMLEVRYQFISCMPEYCDKSIEELRLEDYTAKRLNGRQQRPASTKPRPPVFRFGENNDHVFPPAENAPIFDFDSNRSQTSVANRPFNFLSNNSNRVDRTTTFVPPNRDNSLVDLHGEKSAASSVQAKPFDKFEDHALKVPLQPLPLQVAVPSKATLDSNKFIVTRSPTEYCNVFVTISSKIKIDQFIVVQILETGTGFVSGLRLYIEDVNGGPYLQRKLLYADVYCKRNDFLIIWLSEDGEIKVINNGTSSSQKLASFVLHNSKSDQYQLLGEMCGSVCRLRAFIGDRKKAEPFPWKRSITNSVSSALLTYLKDYGSSLSLICELRDDKVVPVDIDLSKNLSTNSVLVKKSENISEPESSDEDKLCKICIDNAADVVLIPCGHLCVCCECSMKLKVRCYVTCPICRTRINSTQKVYFS